MKLQKLLGTQNLSAGDTDIMWKWCRFFIAAFISSHFKLQVVLFVEIIMLK